MTKQDSSTGQQLRALMRSHVEKTAAPVAPLAQPATTAPAKTQSPKPTAEHKNPTRYSLRMLFAEIEKINTIIKATLQQTGERITLTDVLRVGLIKLTDSSPITREQIHALRESDGRRIKAKG